MSSDSSDYKSSHPSGNATSGSKGAKKVESSSSGTDKIADGIALIKERVRQVFDAKVRFIDIIIL